eukprot:CAMPEP_0181171540 /NCGR_PEP_ID=MMETSP1096-20121128/1966_1 /TAXON_ID=156174 ORGANISM="Chrysochromulina ericina, Strain CCMP281" /NCGR_SAMPLE_ID=MMETSP1096 /ASSEMBLY_ACC=CAM_ASM_000453 /LENGTH=147 /DNA_ID=CAMNT_0023259199 /DNA_START=155 /DNA_END=598 /DNA_ORIENTATION=+
MPVSICLDLRMLHLLQLPEALEYIHLLASLSVRGDPFVAAEAAVRTWARAIPANLQLIQVAIQSLGMHQHVDRLCRTAPRRFLEERVPCPQHRRRSHVYPNLRSRLADCRLTKRLTHEQPSPGIPEYILDGLGVALNQQHPPIWSSE